MSRLDTLCQHALDITLKHKSTIHYGIIPYEIYNKVIGVNNGIPNHNYVQAMVDFIYDGEIEQICHA